mmetsp:Transcript_7726/g.10758  ORF Transcript_7726/g.10758 Transcript_7726/m.10758 type:complete len:431 (-) Transcript_7726:231-1523(-)
MTSALVGLQQMDSALLKACAIGNESALKYAIEHGADTIRARDPMGANCAHMAALGGQLRVAVWLPRKLQRMSDAQGILPLHFAAHNGHLQLVAFFVQGENGLEQSLLDEWFNQENDVLNMRSKFIETLQKKDALSTIQENISLTDAHGGTALHHAALGGHLPILRYLIHYGANTNTLTVDRLTPEDIAKQVGHIHVLILLKSFSKHLDDLQELSAQGNPDVDSDAKEQEEDPDQAAIEEAQAEAESFRQQEIFRLFSERQTCSNISSQSNDSKVLQSATQQQAPIEKQSSTSAQERIKEFAVPSPKQEQMQQTPRTKEEEKPGIKDEFLSYPAENDASDSCFKSLVDEESRNNLEENKEVESRQSQIISFDVSSVEDKNASNHYKKNRRKRPREDHNDRHHHRRRRRHRHRSSSPEGSRSRRRGVSDVQL